MKSYARFKKFELIAPRGRSQPDSAMEHILRLIPGPQPAWISLGATTLIILIAFAVRLSLSDGGRYGFIYFIVPILASALLFGRIAGFYAVALSVALVVAIIPWTNQLAANVSAITVFALVGACVVYVSDGLHRVALEARAARAEADLLLQEMSHRVKNKFAMISSIISLQARGASLEAKHALEDVAARVNIIATVHDYLQLSRRAGLIDMSDYLPGLCKALRDALCGPRPVALSAQAMEAHLPAEKALAIGLIVNELVTNAFKYAFVNDQPGLIQVALSYARNEYLLTVEDDGTSFAGQPRQGLGSRLISVFAAQLGGRASWEATATGGCRAAIRFPKT